MTMSLLFSGSLSPAESDQLDHPLGEPPPLDHSAHDADMTHEDSGLHERHSQDDVTSMAEPHAHLGPHFRWTTRPAARPASQERADGIVTAPRKSPEP